MKQKTALLVEDDRDAASVLEAYLQRENFNVFLAFDGQKGLETALQIKPDIILLDVMLPRLNGTEVLANLRKKINTPIIMLTAMGDATDKIGALRYGADDYVVKPYHPGEVMARVQAVLRRTQKPDETADILRYQYLTVDCSSMSAIVHTTQHRTILELTPTEFSLLSILLRTPLKVFSRLELLETCLPESNALERVVDTHIYNLRKKLENAGLHDVLINVRSIGYRFSQL